MEQLKQKALVLILLSLAGILINIVMFAASIGNWLVLLVTIVLTVYALVTLKKAME
jgi:uncharacterized membrane protein